MTPTAVSRPASTIERWPGHALAVATTLDVKDKQ